MIYKGTICYLECLVKDDEIFGPLASAIQDTLLDLCYPINTVYLEIFKNHEKGLPPVKTYRKFLEVLGITYEDFSRVIPQLSNALMVAMIRHTTTPLSPLRRVTTEIRLGLEQQQPDRKYMTLNNPGCRARKIYLRHKLLVVLNGIFIN